MIARSVEVLGKHSRDGAFRGGNDARLDPAFRSWNLEAYLPDLVAPIPRRDERLRAPPRVTWMEQGERHGDEV